MSWKPRLLQESKENQDGWCRAKRRPHRLLNIKWDSDRNDWRDKSWKRHRKTQYKTEAVKGKKDSRKFAEHMKRRQHFWWDHRRCSCRARRCPYCWKNNVWEDMTRAEWKEEKRLREEEKLIAAEKYYKKLISWKFNHRKMLASL